MTLASLACRLIVFAKDRTANTDARDWSCDVRRPDFFSKTNWDSLTWGNGRALVSGSSL